MKKIFSALMFAVVLLGMTNVMSSCKDYDYDIEQLRKELNNKSSLEQFQDSVNNLNKKIQQELAASALAKQTADEAVKAAAEARKAGLDAAAQAKAAAEAADKAIEAKLKEYADKAEQDDANLKAELEAYVDKARQDALAAAKEYVDKELTTLRDSISNAYTKIAQLNDEITALKTKVDNIPVEEFKTNIKTLQEQYTEIRNRFTAIVGAYSTMVTSVDIFQQVKEDGSLYAKPALNFMISEEQANTFGIGGKQITFTDKKSTVYSDSIIIRVNPVGATITKSMVKLLDSQNNSLDNFVEVDKVEQVEELLTSRSATPNGLWKIVFKLKDGFDANAFTRAIGATFNANGGVTAYRLFAIGITNSKTETLDTRCIVSNYGLKVKTSPANRASDLTVNGKSISIIKNRFTEGGPLAGTTAATKQLRDYLWSNAVKSTPLSGNPAVAAITTGSDANIASVFDVRNDKAALNVTNIDGKYEMEFDFSSAGATDGVRAFYVTLDTAYVSSIENGIDPTEREAWLRYHYTNLNTLIDGSRGVISVDESVSLEREEIGFRVFAVNYDGTLADPDGMAFYVILGDDGPAQNQEIEASIYPSRTDPAMKQVTKPLGSEFNASRTWDKITYCSGINQNPNRGIYEPVYSSTDAGSFVVYAEKDAIGQYLPFDVVFRSNADGTGTIVTPKNAKSITIGFRDEVVKYLDNETYIIPLKLVNSKEDNAVVYTVNLKVKKTLPAFEGLAFNPGVLDGNNTFTAFVTDNTGSWSWTGNSYTQAAYASYNLKQTVQTDLDANWEITISDISSVQYTASTHAWTNIPAENVIGDAKDQSVYAVKAVYTDPLSKQDANNTKQKYSFDYKVRLVSWWYNMKTEYKEDGAPNLKWGEDLVNYDLHNIIVTTQTSLLGVTNVSALLGETSTSQRYIYAPKFSLSGDIASYFTISSQSQTSVSFSKTTADAPSVDVAGKLIVEGKDIFGKDVKIEMPLTMKK